MDKLDSSLLQLRQSNQDPLVVGKPETQDGIIRDLSHHILEMVASMISNHTLEVLMVSSQDRLREIHLSLLSATISSRTITGSGE